MNFKSNQMKKIFLLTMLFVTSISMTFAQKSVMGTVTDESGLPIPGVNIVKKNTTEGTITDIDGKYSIQNVKDTDILVFNFIGFDDAEKQVGTQSVINVVMTSANIALNEVVAVGYGTTKRKDLTGAVASVKVADIVKTPTANFDQALAGRVSGVLVSSADGTPGEGLNIVIRGGNSITGDNSPLYVVDGIPLEGFDPASISTKDIESFDVLKDASATAIYGSRGANGVIIITTKKGRSDGKTDISVSGTFGVQYVPNRLEVLSPYEYAKYQKNVAYAKDGYVPGSYVKSFLTQWVDPELYINEKGTSWQDEIFRQAMLQNYNFTISGGNEKSTIYYGGEYLKQEGTLINTGFNKIINNLRFTHKVNKKLSFNGNIQYSRIKRSGINISGNSYTSVIRDAIQFRPVEPINNDGREEGGYDPLDPSYKYLFNPVKNLNGTDRQRKQDVVRGGLGLNYKILQGLTLRLNANYQTDIRKESVFYGANTLQGSRGNGHIKGTVTNRKYENLSTSNTLVYDKKVRKHKYQLLGGFEAQSRTQEYGWMQNSEIPTDAFGIDNIGIGVSPSIPRTSFNENQLISYFGKVHYSFADRYLMTANFRADASSKFRKENQWGYFPSFSFGWRIMEESFIKDLNVFSNLKLRTGWGLTGNNRIGDYDAFNLLGIDYRSGFVWGDGESFAPGAYQTNLGVPDLRWETTEQINVGLDFGFLSQRISGDVNYYVKNTKDLLLDAEMALSTGFDKVQQNIGQVQNQGLEIAINTVNIKRRDFEWKTNFNISFNKNKTVKLNDGQEAIYTNPNWLNGYSEYQYITEVGQPVGMMYGLKYDGIYQVDDFNWDNASQTYVLKEGIPDNGALPVGPGSVRFVDQNGDGTVNQEDRVVIGDPHPDHFGGFTNDFKYKNFDLQVFFQWSYGFDILNANKVVFDVPGARPQSGFPDRADSWTPFNTDTNVGTILYNTVYGAPPKGNQVDDRYIEDGSYLKLKTISFGYNLPKTLLERINIQRCRLSFSAQNLYTWTNYSGYDPDVSVGRYGALTPKLDYSAYPQSVTLSGSIELTF
jgi:TonB-linked SusC/RagA family outer membrane protein